MLAKLQVYDDLEPKPAALNMAVDEALLTEVTVPILRFYRWLRPSLSFGYFGVYAEAALESEGRELVRRWTGGGIVPHGDDLTYSVIIPKAHPFFSRSSREIYAAFHEAICRALTTNDIEATLLDNPAPKISEHCFASPVRADVISGGRKIAGAAHRRSRAGLLHQGSIQHSNLPDRFRADFALAVSDRYETRKLTAEVVKRAANIAASKYGTTEWLMRR